MDAQKSTSPRKTSEDSSLSPPSSITAADTETGAQNATSRGNTPTVGTKTESTVRFLDIFRSTKEIKRIQKHEQVLEAIKAYASINKEMKVLNKQLDELINILKVATGGGNKSLLEAAVGEAKDAVTNYSDFMTRLALRPENQRELLDKKERDRYQSLEDQLVEKHYKLATIQKSTFNFSEDVKKKIDDELTQWDIWAKKKNHNKLNDKYLLASRPPARINNPDGTSDLDDDEEI